MTRKLNRILLALLLVFGLPGYWLLYDNRPGDIPAKPVTIAQLRSLAASLPGAAPSGVEYEVLAERSVPGNLFAAGSGFRGRSMGVMVYRLPVQGGRAVMIDSGLTRSASTSMGMENYSDAASQRIAAALRSAGTIVMTHEHIDHEGGVVALGDPGVLARVRFNAAQISGNRWTEMLPWPKSGRPGPTISGTEPMAVAPGVVVIPAPSHTPGSQMIYVRLASGRELLFAGDIATLEDSWRDLRARSRLVSDFLAPENRAEVFSWLRTMRALKAEAPRLDIVPGHDTHWITHDETRRGFIAGLRN
jgi:glyoxylase-like metal-dependent hydrolase (beta-lactamase superfamily II)